MTDKAIETVMMWGGNPDDQDGPLLDWMGRESKYHMPKGTWLKQNCTLINPLPGDYDPNMTYSLAFYGRPENEWAHPGDYVCKMDDGSFEARKGADIDLLKMPDGKVAFYSRDPRDRNTQTIREIG